MNLPSRGACRILLALMLGAPHGVLCAQRGARVSAACDGTIVTAIDIRPSDPSFQAFPAKLRRLIRAVGIQQTTTKPEVIARFLAVAVGEPCTELARAESERILRLQPFLADATVRALPDTTGGVRLVVETLDDVPGVFALQMRDGRPAGVRLGNGNIGGQGLYLAASATRGFAYRDGFGVTATARQSFGRPYVLGLVAERAPLGSTVTLSLTHPFFTALQRSAWHVGVEDRDRYVPFARPELDPLSLSVRRRFADAGYVRRLGIGRRTAFAGGLLTHEAVSAADRAVLVSDSGLIADTTGAVGTRAVSYRNTRVNAVFGIRSLTFMPVRGFDALRAVQDAATGVQLGALVGRSFARFGGGDDDVLIAASVYAGRGSARSFAALRIDTEARHGSATDHWDGLMTSGRLAWYVKPAPAHVLIASTEVVTGSRQQVPFQLRLSDRDGGVRGYGRSRIAGATRAVARLEHRWSMAERSPRMAFGIASFADAGRVWAGEAPFGVTSPTRIGIGAGLLASFPPQSPRLWRLDVAIPVHPDAHARWEVRLSSVWTRTFWREPFEVARARAGAAPTSIFTWP